MAVNFFDTHTLLASVQLLPPLHTFLLDRYFPTNEASDIFSTDDVLVEYKNGKQDGGSFCCPKKRGNYGITGWIHDEAVHTVLYCSEKTTHT